MLAAESLTVSGKCALVRTRKPKRARFKTHDREVRVENRACVGISRNTKFKPAKNAEIKALASSYRRGQWTHKRDAKARIKVLVPVSQIPRGVEVRGRQT